MKKLSKKATQDEKSKLSCLMATLTLCGFSFAHYILNPFALSPSTMLAVSLISNGASFLPLLVPIVESGGRTPRDAAYIGWERDTDERDVMGEETRDTMTAQNYY